MNKLLVILGPTSTGKTDLAFFLAKRFNGELVSADSRQIYRGLDIGTGKMPDKFEILNLKFKIEKGRGYWVIGGIRIWMYDVVSPKRQYNVARFVKDAEKVAEKIHKNGKLPIIVGGTGLYIRALIEGLSNMDIPVDSKLRDELQKLTLNQLQSRLKKISPAKWKQMNNSDIKNPRRLIRAVELVSMYPYMDTQRKTKSLSERCNLLKIGLIAPREFLYRKSDERVIKRINQGMIEEAKNLYSRGLSLKRMKQLGLEYGVLADYLAGHLKTKDELIKILEGKIHGYIRRQLAWFKKEEGVNWFDISGKNYLKEVENLVYKWYD